MVAVWQPWLPMSYDYFSSTRVISNIVDIIQENSNTTRHTLYFDNFLNNYEPLVKSSGLKMRAIGTILLCRSNGADAVMLPDK
ncbi:ribosome recycling factor [Trichinella spiralis]|uniref:ribosome recycling factor n=1 Tax=Trichinella spiralis TaxID=6334 RepID=UPI0001EFCF6C|nr:ribosome recycling factor [Trichinella spiralis]